AGDVEAVAEGIEQGDAWLDAELLRLAVYLQRDGDFAGTAQGRPRRGGGGLFRRGDARAARQQGRCGCARADAQESAPGHAPAARWLLRLAHGGLLVAHRLRGNHTAPRGYVPSN